MHLKALGNAVKDSFGDIEHLLLVDLHLVVAVLIGILCILIISVIIILLVFSNLALLLFEIVLSCGLLLKGLLTFLAGFFLHRVILSLISGVIVFVIISADIFLILDFCINFVSASERLLVIFLRLLICNFNFRGLFVILI